MLYVHSFKDNLITTDTSFETKNNLKYRTIVFNVFEITEKKVYWKISLMVKIDKSRAVINQLFVINCSLCHTTHYGAS